MPSIDWYDCPVVIPYYGGKYELSRRLVPMLAPHSRYVEMFAGGLSMFFRKPRVKWNVLNDKDNDIVNLYMTVIYEIDTLIDTLFWLPKSRHLFLNFREELRDDKIDIPDPIRAAKYFYCIRQSFNKLINTPFSKNKDMVKDWDKELRYSRKAIGGATIENLDFEELVDKYPPTKDDFWYLDPPYFIATDKAKEGRDYYRQCFESEDHKRLRDCVKRIHDSGAKFMISYDYRPEVLEYYSDYDIITLNLRYTGATGTAREKERKEYVVLNYKSQEQTTIF